LKEQKKTRVVIAGGGTAGWMAAATLVRQLKEVVDIVLVESEDIGTVGVGEATIPPMRVFHQLLRIDEREFMRETSATFKLGILFENWGKIGDNYIHPFGKTGKETWMAEFLHFWLRGRELGVAGEFGEYCLEWVAAREHKFSLDPKVNINYAYHFDASLYGKFLRKLAEAAGVRRVEGKIMQVKQSPDTGFIESLVMTSGEMVAGDLFIDCTGFRGLLIEQTLHTGYEDWSHWLINDSAVAVQTAAVGPTVPYTRSVAHENGWRWCIPLQHRVGNGSVYSSRHISDDEATAKLLADVKGETLTDPRVIRFRTGRRRRNWNKNVLALGLASGFVEPLESTSIHLIMTGITRLMHLFPFDGIQPAIVDEYNRQSCAELEKIRDFIILHYKVTDRDDSAYWRYCRDMAVPNTLAERIELFRVAAQAIQKDGELFRVDSWTQVMLGQGLMPQSYHPFPRIMSDKDLTRLLAELSGTVRKKVEQLPEHDAFIQEYCGIKKGR
jgi:tryptophan 7-halogenase